MLSVIVVGDVRQPCEVVAGGVGRVADGSSHVHRVLGHVQCEGALHRAKRCKRTGESGTVGAGQGHVIRKVAGGAGVVGDGDIGEVGVAGVGDVVGVEESA